MTHTGWYVCGTDTGVGKTHVAAKMVGCLRHLGHRTAVMKPVASGCRNGRNADALQLMAATDLDLPYALVNPYAYTDAIAPHIAAAGCGRTIDFAAIGRALEALRARSDLVVVEGVGGVAVPLTDDRLQSDLIHTLGLPAILVVGLKLGCINHALLSQEHLEGKDIELAGWVANAIDATCQRTDAIIETLDARIDAPLLGCLPHGVDAGHELILCDGMRHLLATAAGDMDDEGECDRTGNAPNEDVLDRS